MRKIIMTAMAVSFYLCASAQTQGTSALSLGISVNNVKNDRDLGNMRMIGESKTNSYSLGYGLFFKDNQKIGLEFGYSKNDEIYRIDNQTSNNLILETIGGSISYQKYFPIVKSLFAYAGGKLAYASTKSKDEESIYKQDLKGDNYAAGAYGGVTWFLSPRFAFETSLLSANAQFNKISDNTRTNNYPNKMESTSFNLSTEGFVDNLGFKIYLLF